MSRRVRPTTIHLAVALSFRYSVISITTTPTSSHLVGVKIKSPELVSRKNPRGGLVLVLGTQSTLPGGIQYGVMG